MPSGAHTKVIDEYGGTAGMVTFESLMEPIVGELATGGLSRISVLPGGAADIDGLVLPAEVNLQFGLHIDQDTFTTVGGFVLGQLGRRPHIGDVVAIDGRTLRVEALDGIRVARVKLSAAVPAAQDSAKGRGSDGLAERATTGSSEASLCPGRAFTRVSEGA